MKKHTFTSTILTVLTLSGIWPSAHAQTCETGKSPSTTPSGQFFNPADGTVTDTQTGLMWKRCPEGQHWDKSNNACTGEALQLNWQQALEQASNTNAGIGEPLGYSDWRVPNIKELASLVERTCQQPTINLNLFPDTQPTSYWTSSPSSVLADSIWILDFTDGLTHTSRKNSLSLVRLVRNK